MKKLLSIGLILGLISASNIAFGQIQKMDEMTITPPTLNNAEYNNLQDHLQASVKYPSSAYNDKLQGTEVIRFAVTSSGTIEDITVINSVSWEIDEEVIGALLSTNDKWNPGTIDGQPTTMVRELSMIFALKSYDDMLKAGQCYMQKGNKLLYNQNKPKRALQYFNKVQTLFPYETSVQLVRGSCLDQLGLSADAVKTPFADESGTTLLVLAK